MFSSSRDGFFFQIGEENTPYEHNFGDALLPDQMWSAVESRLFTDVTIRCRERTFGAHRAILSARSPVLDALLNSGGRTTDAAEELVIDGMEPDTFEHLLHFLYTGQLRVSAHNEQLRAAADKYKLSTLSSMCAMAESTMDEEEVATALLKYWVQTA